MTDRIHFNALPGQARSDGGTTSVPGPGTPTWTVDEWGDLRFDGDVIYPSEGPQVLRAGYPFLAADIVAARVHEGCGPAADTLRQARELAARAAVQANGSDEWMAPVVALLDLLVDGGTDD